MVKRIVKMKYDNGVGAYLPCLGERVGISEIAECDKGLVPLENVETHGDEGDG
jgi:hypothetical protein